jgi:hypothetical protein
MKWRKLGKIFDPTEHHLPNECVQFAQSPQALVFDDFVRVYFSTRCLDRTGKFLSHVAFVDFDKNLRHIINISNQSVIDLGGLGCFDEHGIFPINVVRHGERVLAYTCGWSRRVSVSIETAIGFAVSSDRGRTFKKVGDGPIMGPSLYEPYLVGDAFVKIIDNTFHMWRIFGTSWKRFGSDELVDRTYKIGHAVSTDGINWSEQNGIPIIPDKLGPDECQALPTVVQIGHRYHMLFCYRHSFDFRSNIDRGYRIGHAWSDDLSAWVRDDGDLVVQGTAGEWDGDMQCYPHVFECDGRVYLLYNGNEFGKYGFGLAELEH